MANTPRLDRLEQNYLINGGMDFPQRIGSATVNLSSSVVYYLDRWLARFNGTYSGTPTIHQEAASPDSRSIWCTRVDGNASNSSANYEFRQRIESIHCLDMVAEGTASFSAWIYSGSATSADLRLFTADASDNFSAVTAFPSGIISRTLTVGQWNLVKWENVSVPSGGVRGIEFRVELNNMSVTGTSQVHRWTQVQAVSGTRAPNFARHGRGISQELIACERYYEKTYPLNVAPGTTSTSGSAIQSIASNSGECDSWWSFKVSKRADNYTLSLFSPVTGAANRADSGGDKVISAGSSNNRSGFSLNSGAVFGASSNYLFHWAVDAEL